MTFNRCMLYFDESKIFYEMSGACIRLEENFPSSYIV